MNRADPVTVSVDRFGYRIGGDFYRRVTTELRGVPKPWLGGWAAKQVAGYALERLPQLAAMIGAEPDMAEAVRLLQANERLPESIESRDAIKAVYDMLKGSPWQKRDDAADRGTAVHEAIHAYLEDRPIPDSLTNEDQLSCAIAAEAWLRDRKPKPLGAEVTVYSPTMGYAGTLDLWCMMDGEEWIIDWKTSGDVYVEHAIQQVAYAHADFAVTDKVKIGDDKWTGRRMGWAESGARRPVRLGIVHVTPDGAVLYPIQPGAIPRLWTAFRAAAHIKAFLADTDTYGNKTPKLQVYATPEPVNVQEAVA